MPVIKLKHVVSCSSADTTHTAENLLKADTYRKWKAARPGEKQISVILQFEKEEQIHSIDIGNEGSAFVEVLVGRSTSISEQEYEVLLGMSSFMSPSESKNESNLNRTRMFGPDKLVKGAAEKKWDRVKIMCTQPYTKPQVTPPKTPPATQSYAAAALQGTAETSSSTEKQIKTPPSNNITKEPSSSKRKFEFNKEPSSHSAVKKPDVKESPSSTKAKTSSQPAPKKPKVETPPTKKPSPSEKPNQKKSPPSSQPMDLGRILQGTVFVLSGFQNPFRSDLRDKALEMGAKYRPDWTPDSTHLICAFANTPKFSQVKAAGGIIVRKEWVLDCYKKRQRLPQKQYLLGTAESSSDEEDDSEEDEPPKAPQHKPHPDPSRTNHKKPSPSPAKVKEKRAPIKSEDEDTEDENTRIVPSKANHKPKQEDEYDASTDEEATGERQQHEDDSGEDTEDELRRFQEEKQGKKAAVKVERVDPYAGSTDENTDEEEKPELDLPIPALPDLFLGKKFFLYGEFPAAERRVLSRYIIAFNGELEEYMNEKVQYVITAQEWDDSFEDALNENTNVSFVRPRWIYNCNERQKCIPHQPYVVVPKV
ncbi:hypothetical protein XELAEV_18003960mg [Xenopus laevis]|uniref:DNA repair protein XRCC1 n=1 Tax=Xenopus laevis TaxID=8355 RepID=A0A974BS45_XENLA|nr:hypothetical protein XELAEV_18003960mg [Xenopus laevis]